MERVAIIGGGISGLCAAYALQKSGVPYDLFEASDRLGGYILSKELYPNALFELGPNTILADEDTLAFFNELGLKPIVSNPLLSKNRFIARRDGIRALPSSPPALLFSSFFSLKTRLLFLKELFRRPYSIEANESLSDTFERHFGREVVELALRPFVQGIYGAPPELLLTELCFPSLLSFAERYGSFLKGFAKNAKLSKKKLSVSFANGLYDLVAALQACLSSVHLNTAVAAVSLNASSKGGVILHFANGSSTAYSRVVVATGLQAAANLLPFAAFGAAALRVPFVSAVSIQSVWEAGCFPRPCFNGFGCLHTEEAHLRSAGTIFVSSVFPSRSSPSLVLLNSIVLNPNGVPLSFLEKQVCEELQSQFEGKASPLLVHSFSWPNAFPVYGRELKALWQEVDKFPSELMVIGNWYRGISLNDLIRKGLGVVS